MLNQRDRGLNIRKWVWDPEWSHYYQAEKLFCDFTQQYWDSITQSVFQDISATPATLEEVMKYWTLESVEQGITTSCSAFISLPLSILFFTLLLQSPRISFLLRNAPVFFPEVVKHKTNPAWALCYKYGYVKDYHTALAESADDGKSFKDALNGIFSNLQVLPFDLGKPTDLKSFWRWNQEAIEIHLNSSYLELPDKRIWHNNKIKKEMRQRGINKTRPRVEIEKKLLQKLHSIYLK